MALAMEGITWIVTSTHWDVVSFTLCTSTHLELWNIENGCKTVWVVGDKTAIELKRFGNWYWFKDVKKVKHTQNYNSTFQLRKLIQKVLYPASIISFVLWRCRFDFPIAISSPLVPHKTRNTMALPIRRTFIDYESSRIDLYHAGTHIKKIWT